MKQPDYTLYMVTDMPSVYKKGFLESIEAAVAGGVSIVQYRTDGGTKHELYENGMAVRDLLKRLGVPLIINDHVDLALALDADGVHIGQGDLPAPVVRRLIGKDKLLGLSTSNREQVLAVDKTVVDYIGIGPVFPTQSKRNAPPAIGAAGLAELVPLSPVPMVGIGGITAESAPAIYATGVTGIAIVSAISYADDPRAAAAALLAAKK
ncbi:thiamine-phosphate pyrophosphorylase [Ereboglobus sp. PH5-10]|uniref:thiamine phosphate synthase n=1 Tax=Ereboglobus sp. PH5-10 TaxID=2940629 RepID=UPI002407721E|nr:thiamine phosphate synthase [Ereboglobus sp. PH5-10]MDF9826639.1 thiamine-phosphate pyrophosphorylase [Ereboglobus sp. PH5-10]